MSCCGSNKSCGGAPSSPEKKCLPKPSEDELRNAVRDHYAKIVNSVGDGGCCSGGSCFVADTSEQYALKLGYTKDDLAALPDGANIGQGCGNPLAIAQLKPGEVVLDLGSGAGFDAFLAVKAVGKYLVVCVCV